MQAARRMWKRGPRERAAGPTGGMFGYVRAETGRVEITAVPARFEAGTAVLTCGAVPRPALGAAPWACWAKKPQRRGRGPEPLMEDEKTALFLLVLMENCVIITLEYSAETAWGRPADEKARPGMDGSSARRCSLLPSCVQILFENEISQNIKRGGRIRGRLFCWLEYSNRGGIEPQGWAISPEHGPAGVPRCAAGGGHAGFSHGCFAGQSTAAFP